MIFMFVIFAGARYQRISYPNKVQTSVLEVLRTFPTAGTTVATRHKLEGKNLARLSVGSVRNEDCRLFLLHLLQQFSSKILF